MVSLGPYELSILLKYLYYEPRPIRAGAYPGFCSMKRLGVFLLPLGWDASPSQGYPQYQVRRYPFIHLGGERHRESILPKITTKRPRAGLEPRPLAPETSALKMSPPRLHEGQGYKSKEYMSTLFSNKRTARYR